MKAIAMFIWMMLLTAVAWSQCDTFRTQGYTGGCDNIYLQWTIQQQPREFELIFSDGFAIRLPGSASNYTRKGIGCGWYDNPTIHAKFDNGTVCIRRWCQQPGCNPPHNRQCSDAACGGAQARLTVAHAANFRSSAAPGAIAALFGENLAATTAGAVGQLPYELAGVSVTVADTPAQLFFVSPKQVNILIPRSVPLGLVSVRLINQERSVTGDVFLTAHAPGIFTASQDGQGMAAANYIYQPSIYPANAYAVLYLSGLQLSAQPSPAELESLRSVTTVAFDGKFYRPSYVGPAPGFAGLQQINVPIPRERFLGFAQGLYVQVGAFQSNGVELLFTVR